MTDNLRRVTAHRDALLADRADVCRILHAAGAPAVLGPSLSAIHIRDELTAARRERDELRAAVVEMKPSQPTTGTDVASLTDRVNGLENRLDALIERLDLAEGA